MHGFWSKTKFRNFLTLFKYEPVNYWQTRGKVFYKENPYEDKEWRGIEGQFISYISKLKFESVLEFGCGFGRITSLMLKNFPNIKKYKAVDLSPHQIENAKKYVNNDKVEFEVSTIQDLDETKKYDLVIGFAVLMHVPPQEIEKVIKKLVNLSKKEIVHSDWDDRGQSKVSMAKFCFIHNYKNIYKNTCNIKNIKTETIIDVKKEHASIFHVKVDDRA